MDRDGLSRLPRCMKRFCQKTFRDISISKARVAKIEYCAEGSHASTITAVDFDSVIRDLYAALWRKIGRLPASLDSIFCSGRVFYGIEFKTGRTNATEIVRKIYDTVLCMIEQCNKSLSWVRNNFQVVIVARRLEVEQGEQNRRKKKNKAMKVVGRSIAFQKYPRIGEGATPLWGLEKIEGLVASKIYTITPTEFDEFCERHDWR